MINKRWFQARFNRLFRRKAIELELKRFSYADHWLEMSAQHPQIAVIAQELGKFFIASGGKNFLELTMFDPATIGTFTLTMQKAGRPGDAQVREKMRAALELIHDHPEQAAAESERVLRALGYLEPTP